MSGASRLAAEMKLLNSLPGEMLVLLRVLATLAAALMLTWIAKWVTNRFERRVIADDPASAAAARIKRARTLGKMILAASRIAIWAVTIVMVLGHLGQDVRPLLAAAGVGGIAIGFGAQNVVRDVLAGFFILFEHQYDVDDIVNIAGISGKVEAVGLRTTTLRDLEGARHVVPNGEISTSTNLTKDFSRYLFDLPVSYEQDIDHAVDVARKAAEDMRAEPQFRDLIVVPLEVLGVDSYANSAVNVKVYVETLPGQQYNVGRQLRGRIKAAWDAEGISVPYPHQEMIIKRETEAPSPPLDGNRQGEKAAAGPAGAGS